MAVKKAVVAAQPEFPQVNWPEMRLLAARDGDTTRVAFIEHASEFSGCCAFTILAGLHAVRLLTIPYAASVCLNLRERAYGPILLATTIPDQAAEIDVLKAIGFKRLGGVTNPNTNNKVTVWQASIRP